MKKIVVLFSTFGVFICCICGILSVSAAGYSRFDTEEIPAEEQSEFLVNVQFVPSLASNPICESISCFAISEQGQIALGFNDSEHASVHVYNSAGNFLYGYRFINRKSAYTLFFEGEELSIIWSRSKYIGSFDQKGNCIRLRRDLRTKNNSDEEYKERWRSAKGTIGTLSYHAKRSGILPKYTVFTVEDIDGNRTVIYDAKKEIFTKNILVGIGVACFSAFFAYGLYCQEKQKRADQKNVDTSLH